MDEAEDFWIRQKPPDDMACSKHIQAHPHMQYFKKIQESPVYGPSKHKRLVAKSVSGPSLPKEDEDEPTNPGFRLRSYQLEGVNWLLFNWWNQRSCILADGMFSAVLQGLIDFLFVKLFFILLLIHYLFLFFITSF